MNVGYKDDREFEVEITFMQNEDQKDNYILVANFIEITQTIKFYNSQQMKFLTQLTHELRNPCNKMQL